MTSFLYRKDSHDTLETNLSGEELGNQQSEHEQQHMAPDLVALATNTKESKTSLSNSSSAESVPEPLSKLLSNHSLQSDCSVNQDGMASEHNSQTLFVDAVNQNSQPYQNRDFDRNLLDSLGVQNPNNVYSRRWSTSSARASSNCLAPNGGGPNKRRASDSVYPTNYEDYVTSKSPSGSATANSPILSLGPPPPSPISGEVLTSMVDCVSAVLHQQLVSIFMCAYFYRIIQCHGHT